MPMRSTKRFLLVLLLLCSTAFPFLSHAQGEALAPQGIDGEFYFAPFDVSITLDGDISDWEGVPRVTMPAGLDPTAGGPGISFAAAADGDHLYLLGEVYDSNIVTGEHDLNYWNEDSLEFYLNASGNLTLDAYEAGVVQLTIPALNATEQPSEPVLAGVQGADAQADIAASTTDTGWLVEVALPLRNDVWSILPTHGGILGFQVHLNASSGGDRDSKLVWSLYDTADQSYLNPSVFGFLVFYEVGSTDIPDLRGTVALLTQPPEADPLYVPLDAPYRNPTLPIETRVEDLLARMTLDEKIGQMTLVEKNSIARPDITDYSIGGLLSGGGGAPNDNSMEGWAAMIRGFQEYALESRLGIPLLYSVDAVHGHNNVRGAVIFPHNIGLGAGNNPDLVEAICRATALEVLATGIYWNYSPVLAVPQDVRWGRTYEGYSEDTALVTTLATACLRGLQGDDLGAADTLLGTPKHFVGDGGAAWGTSTTGDYEIDQGVTLADEATLRELHLAPYYDAIDAGAMSIMASFSSWDGTKMHGHEYLITEVLKGEMGFEGFVVSDWQGIDQINPASYYQSVVASINAGVDMNMVPYDYPRFIETMQEAIANGDISEARIDDAVRRILRVKFELGLFEWPFAQSQYQDEFGGEAHRELARQAVRESLVLLQNTDATLPLSKDTPTIFVAGEGADSLGMQSGGWTISWQGGVDIPNEGTTILEGIEAAVSADTSIYYDRLGRFLQARDEAGEPLRADVGIVVVGEAPYAEGIGDSPDLALPTIDLNVLNRVRERADRVVVVLLSGRPVDITALLPLSDAFVAAWLPGTEGAGVADVLFGDYPFTGTLPYTWFASVEQLPLNINSLGDEEALFPFGYGLTTE